MSVITGTLSDAKYTSVPNRLESYFLEACIVTLTLRISMPGSKHVAIAIIFISQFNIGSSIVRKTAVFSHFIWFKIVISLLCGNKNYDEQGQS